MSKYKQSTVSLDQMKVIYIDTLMAELPADAVSRFRTESGFESVDRDFCSMIHGSGFLKYDLGGGFAQL